MAITNIKTSSSKDVRRFVPLKDQRLVHHRTFPNSYEAHRNLSKAQDQAGLRLLELAVRLIEVRGGWS